MRKNTSIKNKKNPKLIFNLKDELKINIQFVENNKNSREAWVLIDSVSNSEKSKKISTEINKKTNGYQFLANINTSDVLNWKLKDLIKN